MEVSHIMATRPMEIQYSVLELFLHVILGINWSATQIDYVCLLETGVGQCQCVKKQVLLIDANNEHRF